MTAIITGDIGPRKAILLYEPVLNVGPDEMSDGDVEGICFWLFDFVSVVVKTVIFILYCV